MRKIITWITLGGLCILIGAKIVFALAAEETDFKMKTSKFFIFQETADTASGTTLEKNFNVFVGEQTPLIKSAFIEIRGISGVATAQSIDVQIKQQGDPSYSNLKTFTWDSPSKPTHFNILYDVTSFMSSKITTAGLYGFTHYVKNNGPAALSVVQSRLFLTYQFTPPASGYRATGNIISSTFDTAATNGAAPNSIMWLGTLPATSAVKFQFASSNCSNGTTNPPTCTTGTWSYIGPDGTDTTYYTPSAPDTPLKLDLSHHNNKRYFKYKVTLNPTSDLQQTPTMDDIILNWAP